METKEYEHNGIVYFVTVVPAIHSITNESGFVAYVNNEPPGALLYGASVRDENGNIIFFGDKLTALTNANYIKRGELDSSNPPV